MSSDIIYGRRPVLEALRATLTFEKILFARNQQGGKIAEIRTRAGKNGIPVEDVPQSVLTKMAGTPKTQGVVAVVRSRSYVSVDEILAESAHRDEPPLLALLDSIEDPHNLGAILRTADGAGVHGVVLPKRRSAGVTSTVAKTSAGASAHVLTAQVSNLNYTIDELKKTEVWIVGADQEGDRPYTEIDFLQASAIVIGAEGRGLSRLVKEKCDFLVRIPMFGKVNSLNASVAAALLFFEARRQRSKEL